MPERDNDWADATEYKREVGDFPKCDLQDFSKLKIEKGVIHLQVYGQDGKLAPLPLKDTPMNRLYASWVQIHDRWLGDVTAEKLWLKP